MTSVDYRDSFGEEANISEVFMVPSEDFKSKPKHGKNKTSQFVPFNETETVLAKEEELAKRVIELGGTITKISTIPISKRRFKRRRAKELKKLAKKYNVALQDL